MTAGKQQAAVLTDPELRELAEQMPLVDFTREALPAIRTAITAMLTSGENPSTDGITFRERWVEREGRPALRLLHYCPDSSSDKLLPAILHMHGGGFVLGLPEMEHATNLALTRDLQCHVVSVDYRLAPEWPYPAGLDDCADALDWLCREAKALGVDPTRIGVKGESAGGCLAAALTLRDRDSGNDRIAFQHLTYPMLDDRTGTTEAVPDFVGTIVWTVSNNRFAWDCLLGREPGGLGVPAYASPARTEDLIGLPPTFLSVGTLDLFFTENLSFAARLRDAGVPVELHVYPGAFHGFDGATGARIAQQAKASSTQALKRSLCG